MLTGRFCGRRSKTNAYQQNNNILLNEETLSTQTSIRNFADDVNTATVVWLIRLIFTASSGITNAIFLAFLLPDDIEIRGFVHH